MFLERADLLQQNLFVHLSLHTRLALRRTFLQSRILETGRHIRRQRKEKVVERSEEGTREREKDRRRERPRLREGRRRDGTLREER